MCCALLAILVVALAAGWFLQQRKPKSGKRAKTTKSAAGPGKARPDPIWGKRLVIAPGTMPCERAIELAGKCFATDKAPPLPLAGCTVSTCACRYEPLPERRDAGERRNSRERRGEIRFDPDKPDRRSNKDRRKDAYHWESGV